MDEKVWQACINLVGLIYSIWEWLLRLLATMSPVDADWVRFIISLALARLKQWPVTNRQHQ